MRGRWLGATLIAGVAIAAAGSLSAQQPNPAQPSIMKEDDSDAPVIVTPQQSAKPAKPPRRSTKTTAPTIQADPNLDANDQLAPSQSATADAGRGGASRPPRRAARRRDPRMRPPRPRRPPTGAAAQPSGRARNRHGREPHAVACSGVFEKNSEPPLKLAMVFETQKTSTLPRSTPGPAIRQWRSVLFAKDPKRRLEVWWSKPDSRSDTHLIVINGQSTWIAPANLRLGLSLAEVEKLNHKPFKLLGFNKDNIAAGSDWNGGAMANVSGGCKLGINLRADQQGPRLMRSAPCRPTRSSPPTIRRCARSARRSVRFSSATSARASRFHPLHARNDQAGGPAAWN